MRCTIGRASPFSTIREAVPNTLPYEAEVESPTRDPHNALAHIAFTVPWNMSEHPAASINWGFSRDGLPIGVQIVGQRFDDIGVLRLSRALEILRPEQVPFPE